MSIQLIDFAPAEEEMVVRAEEALKSAGYDTSILKVVIRQDDMPASYRGMTLGNDGIILGVKALSSQAMLNYVLEEELLHLQQKASGATIAFGPETARTLEKLVHEQRRFPCPED